MSKKKKKKNKSLLSDALSSLGTEIDKRGNKNKKREENLQKAVSKRKQDREEKLFINSMPSFDHIDLKDEEDV